MWNSGWEGSGPEADDYLHNPDPKRDTKVSFRDRERSEWARKSQ